MNKQNQILKAVSLEDFDAKSLRRAAREGRLFIAQADAEPLSADSAINEILTHVGRISEYATTLRIGHIWNEILYDATLSPLFFLTRYRSTRGHVNWYRVAVVVCVLREMGIYQNGISAKELCQRMEGETRCGNHYSGMGRYQLDVAQTRLLRRILDKYRE